MNEVSIKLLNLIIENTPLTDILSKMDIGYEELYRVLKDLKLDCLKLKTEYYYTGEIKYGFQKKEMPNSFELLTDDASNEITLMCISDQHFGNSREDLTATYKIYDYCLKNNIHIILNGGDLVDGISKYNNQTFDEQIEHALYHYPKDNNILNFITFGNHDHGCTDSKGRSISEIITQSRSDIISLGYGCGILKIKNDNILITHKLNNKSLRIPKTAKSLQLSGHSHCFKQSSNDNSVTLRLPSLSNLGSTDFNDCPSAVKIHITFSNIGIIQKIDIEYLLVEKQISTLFYKTYLINQSKSEEALDKQLIKSLSNIDSFIAKYGNY